MIQPKKILLYGFGPYREFQENITARIIKSLPRVVGLKRVVFPVRFQRGQFVQALERHRPDVVLGLGQSARRSVEFETRAANHRRAGIRAKARVIRKQGPHWLPTTLDIKPGRGLKRSFNAGDYVCNFSMYVMLDHIRRAGAKTRFGFMHIPYDLALHKASRVVAGTLRKLRRRNGAFLA